MPQLAALASPVEAAFTMHLEFDFATIGLCLSWDRMINQDLSYFLDEDFEGRISSQAPGPRLKVSALYHLVKRLIP